jgi:hypothetical protein
MPVGRASSAAARGNATTASAFARRLAAFARSRMPGSPHRRETMRQSDNTPVGHTACLIPRRNVGLLFWGASGWIGGREGTHQMDELDLSGPVLWGRDSSEHFMLEEAIRLAPMDGLIIEIGLRRGGSMKIILDYLATLQTPSTVVSLDCYGQIMYSVTENDRGIFDYTNDMRNETLAGIYDYIRGKPINFMFFNLEDTEFFDRFADGVPLYAEMHKTFANRYGFVFIDAQHTLASVSRATRFFLNGRDMPGTVMCFDDVSSYNHDAVEELLFARGYRKISRGTFKAVYQNALS